MGERLILEREDLDSMSQEELVEYSKTLEDGVLLLARVAREAPPIRKENEASEGAIQTKTAFMWIRWNIFGGLRAGD